MRPHSPYRIFPLGDSALTIDYGNRMDPEINNEVIARLNQLTANPLPGIIELVPAYSSLTIYYDICKILKNTGHGQSAFQWMKEKLEDLVRYPASLKEEDRRFKKIPVCYENEFAPDLEALARTRGLTKEEVVHIHTTTSYKVYMLGFIPGF